MVTAIEMIPNWKQDNLDPMMELWKKGYLRVTWMYNGALLVNNEVHPPNPKQMAALKNLAIEGDHSKITWDKGDDEKLLWTNQDTLQEGMKGKVEFQYHDPESVSDYDDDINQMLKSSEIYIDKTKNLSIVAIQDGKAVGALYTSITNDEPPEFSFDVMVSKESRGQGIGAKLIDSGLARYREEESEFGAEMRLNVVNPWVKKYLLHKGLVVVDSSRGQTIMAYPKEQGVV